MKLTSNELAFLTAIDHSEYGDNLLDDVWAFTIADNSKLKGKTISGTASSLVKKGLITVSDRHASTHDSTVGFTQKGAGVYVKAVGYANVRKHLGRD